MLKLKFPWRIGSTIFTHIFFGKGEWHSGARRIKAHLCLAIDNGEYFEIGTLQEKEHGAPELRIPNLLVPFSIEDSFVGNPKVAAIFDAGRAFFKLLEEYAVERQYDRGGIAEKTIQFGMEEFSLECERESTNGRSVTVRKLLLKKSIQEIVELPNQEEKA